MTSSTNLPHEYSTVVNHVSTLDWNAYVVDVLSANVEIDTTIVLKLDTDVEGDLTASTIQADNGFTGSFTNGDGDTVTVVGGIITDVS